QSMPQIADGSFQGLSEGSRKPLYADEREAAHGSRRGSGAKTLHARRVPPHGRGGDSHSAPGGPMKAIVFSQTGGPEVLTLSDVPKPDVRPGMVLIKVHAIGVNFADTRFRQGTYVVKPKLPDTPGMEAAGVIEAVGDGVTDL